MINFHKPLVKLGLLHLIATNVCIWIFTIVLEASASYAHVDYMMPGASNLPNTHNNGAKTISNNFTASTINNISGIMFFNYFYLKT